MIDRWESVPDPRDRRRVVYWRFVAGGRVVGSIARVEDRKWRALEYLPSLVVEYPPRRTSVELGLYPTRRAAEKVVEDRARAY